MESSPAFEYFRGSKHKPPWRKCSWKEELSFQFPEVAAFLLVTRESPQGTVPCFHFWQSLALFFLSSRTCLPCSPACSLYWFSYFSLTRKLWVSLPRFLPLRGFPTFNFVGDLLFLIEYLGDYLTLPGGGFALFSKKGKGASSEELFSFSPLRKSRGKVQFFSLCILAYWVVFLNTV